MQGFFFFFSFNFLLHEYCTAFGPHKFSNDPFLSESIYCKKTFIRSVTEDAHNYNRLHGKRLKGNAVGPLQMMKAMSRKNLCGSRFFHNASESFQSLT